MKAPQFKYAQRAFIIKGCGRGAFDPPDQMLPLLTFNGQLPAACLNTHWFLAPTYASENFEALRGYYNEERPHSSIGTKVPTMLTNSGGVTGSYPEYPS
jgi:transposase InsO family protein